MCENLGTRLRFSPLKSLVFYERNVHGDPFLIIAESPQRDDNDDDDSRFVCGRQESQIAQFYSFILYSCRIKLVKLCRPRK